MDSERVILVAGVTAIAAVVGTFILWGPSTVSRPRRKSAVIGLQNLGLTCYLNSLLQAMASCHYFIEWLNIQENQGEVATAMRKLLNILCGNSPPSPEDEYFVSPIEIVNALHCSGWKITNSQQDVHELLCNLITILEEEAHKSCLMISSDAVYDNYSSNEAESQSNLFKENLEISGNLNKDKNSLKSNPSHDDFCVSKILASIDCDGDGLNYANYNSLCIMREKYRLFDYRIKYKLKNNLIRSRIVHDLNQSPRPSPFRGYLTNKIECTKCNYKSVLRYDKFDNISLHLPALNDTNVHTLQQLLNNFVKNEIINDIICEGCNKNRISSSNAISVPAVKFLRFGKLPTCLCIHIVRTTFHEYGVFKRQDYVDFPEYIAMDPYLYKPKKTNTFTVKKELRDLLMKSSFDENLNQDSNIGKHVYRLKAVIVHRGSHNDGHFMTYRRGTADSRTQYRCSDSRWYLVSDTEVKETTLYNVLTSIAYVLFYERCSRLS